MADTTRIAFVFPGQGSQGVGMGSDVYANFATAREVFQEADSTLGFPVSKLCFEGPADELVKTVNVQPAVLTVSIACLRAAGEASGGRLPAPALVAGHSLGEYTALVAAGAISFPDALRLVRERGRLMQAAGEQNPGSMVAVLALDPDAVEDICRQSGSHVANVNCPGQIVISGALASLDAARDLIRAWGGKAAPLKVSGAFHSPLMEPAAAGLRTAVALVAFRNPNPPLVANVTGEPLTGGADVPGELITQLNRRVQWQKSVGTMAAGGVTTFIEIGPGQVLSGLIKRINPAAITLTMGDATGIKAALAAING